jgi:hypothetical protein
MRFVILFISIEIKGINLPNYWITNWRIDSTIDVLNKRINARIDKTKYGYTLLTSKLYHDMGIMQRGDSTIIVYCGKAIDIFITLKL